MSTRVLDCWRREERNGGIVRMWNLDCPFYCSQSDLPQRGKKVGKQASEREILVISVIHYFRTQVVAG